MRKTKARNAALAAAALLMIGAAVVWAANREPSHAPASEPARPAVPVRLVTVSARQPDRTRTYSATIEPERRAELAFRVGGYVESLQALNPGDPIQSGAVLARLRPVEHEARTATVRAQVSEIGAAINAANAQLAEAQATATQARQDLERARVLHAGQALTRVDLDAAQARHDAMAARVDAARAQRASLEARQQGAAAQLREAQVSLQDTALIAPFTGVLVERRVEKGTLADPGATAFIVADLHNVKVRFTVPDVALAHFRPGTPITASAEAAPDQRFTGRITAVAAAADPSSRTFTLEASVANPRRLLRAGMVATVSTADASPAPPEVLVPMAAIVRAGQGFGVYLAEARHGEWRVRRVPVSLGPLRGNEVAVTHGLQPGQRIVGTGGLQLTDGEMVRVIP